MKVPTGPPYNHDMLSNYRKGYLDGVKYQTLKYERERATREFQSATTDEERRKKSDLFSKLSREASDLRKELQAGNWLYHFQFKRGRRKARKDEERKNPKSLTSIVED